MTEYSSDLIYGANERHKDPAAVQKFKQLKK